MDSIVGKWQCGGKDITGVDDFLAALGKPELKNQILADHALEVSRNGNSFTVKVTGAQGFTQSTEVVVGTDKEIIMPYIGKAKAKTSMEGNALVSRATVDGVEVVCKTYVEGGVLIQENSIKGKTLTVHGTRV